MSQLLKVTSLYTSIHSWSGGGAVGSQLSEHIGTPRGVRISKKIG